MKFRKIILTESFPHKESWEEVYKKFQLIIDEFFPNEDEIESRIYNLYMNHQGEEAYEIAYDKWLESNKENLDESLNIDLQKYIQYEDTSWIDDLRDSFQEFEHFLWSEPSIDAIMEKYSLWVPVLQEYFKEYPGGILNENLEFKPITSIVSGIDGSHLEILKNDIIPGVRSFRAEYISGDSTGNIFDFILADSSGDQYLISKGIKQEDLCDLPTECFEVDGKDEGAFYIFDLNEINRSSVVNEDIPSCNKTIEIITTEEECPYLLGTSDNCIEISNRYDLTGDELWSTGWVGAVENWAEGPFESFDQLDMYCYDREKNMEYSLPEIDPATQAKFLLEVNAYCESSNSSPLEEGYKLKDGEVELCKSNNGKEILIKNDNGYQVFSVNDVFVGTIEANDDDEAISNYKKRKFAESFKSDTSSVLEESVEEKADDIQFVIENYLHNQSPDHYEFECVSVDGFTWEVCDYDECLKLVFDPNWSEWVYTINGKGPYSHNSYEYILSELRSAFAELRDKKQQNLEEDSSNDLSAIDYELTYYRNTAGRDRRPTTFEDKKDWVVTQFRADSDLDAWKTAFNIVNDYCTYDEYFDNPSEEDFEQFFDNSDWSDGSPILIKLEGSENILYDAGITFDEWFEGIED